MGISYSLKNDGTGRFYRLLTILMFYQCAPQEYFLITALYGSTCIYTAGSKEPGTMIQGIIKADKFVSVLLSQSIQHLQNTTM